MKNFVYIIAFICFRQISIAQSNFGIKDYVNNSDQIFLIEATEIDTLEPKNYHSMLIYSGQLSYNIIEIYSDELVEDSIPIHFQITEHPHMQKAEPKLGASYIAFTKYDLESNAYTLPEHKYSLVEVSQSNIKTVKNIIESILRTPNLSECDYFDLISTNFNEVILPIERDLITLHAYTNNVDSTYCIDFNKKENIYEHYKLTKNKGLLPFIRNFNQNEIDKQLIEEINFNLNRIIESEELYWIEEAGIVLNNLSNLSYVYNNRNARVEKDNIESEYFSSFDKNFVKNVKNLMKKYGS